MIQKLKLNQYNRIANHVPIIKRNVEYIYIKISITVKKKISILELKYQIKLYVKNNTNSNMQNDETYKSNEHDKKDKVYNKMIVSTIQIIKI